MPPRCGGYIQSLKWKTSSGPTTRSSGGDPSAAPQRAQRVRAAGRRAAGDARRLRPARTRSHASRGRSPARTRRPRPLPPTPRRSRAASRGCSCRRRCARATAATRRRRSSPGRRVPDRVEVEAEQARVLRALHELGRLRAGEMSKATRQTPCCGVSGKTSGRWSVLGEIRIVRAGVVPVTAIVCARP